MDLGRGYVTQYRYTGYRDTHRALKWCHVQRCHLGPQPPTHATTGLTGAWRHGPGVRGWVHDVNRHTHSLHVLPLSPLLPSHSQHPHPRRPPHGGGLVAAPARRQQHWDHFVTFARAYLVRDAPHVCHSCDRGCCNGLALDRVASRDIRGRSSCDTKLCRDDSLGCSVIRAWNLSGRSHERKPSMKAR